MTGCKYCNEEHYARDMCEEHYMKWYYEEVRKEGIFIPKTAPKNPAATKRNKRLYNEKTEALKEMSPEELLEKIGYSKKKTL